MYYPIKELIKTFRNRYLVCKYTTHLLKSFSPALNIKDKFFTEIHIHTCVHTYKYMLENEIFDIAIVIVYIFALYISSLQLTGGYIPFNFTEPISLLYTI